MGAFTEIRRIHPRRGHLLRTLVVLTTAIQLVGWSLLLSGVLGGWPPQPPGGGGPFTVAAKRLVRDVETERARLPVDLQKEGWMRGAIDKFLRFQEEILAAGTKAAMAAAEISLELTLRLGALSTGLVMLLFGGWTKRRILSWLHRIELRSAKGRIEELERRLCLLERRASEEVSAARAPGRPSPDYG